MLKVLFKKKICLNLFFSSPPSLSFKAERAPSESTEPHQQAHIHASNLTTDSTYIQQRPHLSRSTLHSSTNATSAHTHKVWGTRCTVTSRTSTEWAVFPVHRVIFRDELFLFEEDTTYSYMHWCKQCRGKRTHALGLCNFVPWHSVD